MNTGMTTTTNYDNEWQSFLSSIHTYSQHPPEKWTVLSLLSYFVVKYQQVNGVEYVFSHTKKGPTNSREMKAAAKIWEMFDKGRLKTYKTKEEKLQYSEQLVDVLKAYIDWAFNVKMKNRAINITGLGIFAVPNFMNEFLQWRKKQKTARGNRLPQSFINWINVSALDILKTQQVETYDDIKMLEKYIKAYGLDKNSL